MDKKRVDRSYPHGLKENSIYADQMDKERCLRNCFLK